MCLCKIKQKSFVFVYICAIVLPRSIKKNRIMTSRQLIKFRRERKWSQQRMADELGCSRGGIRRWEMSISHIPKYIALACSAITMHIEPFGDRW